jgi:Zn-dependent peptidase ImmA (M78 family)
MLVRGFKSKCENISEEVRKNLGLGNTDPLLPNSLASYLGVSLINPNEIDNLSEQSLIQLIQTDKYSWSAVTISYLGIDLVIYNPSHTRARYSSDIMHELSHIILGHKPSQIVILSPDSQIALRDYNKDAEEEATWLAGCLLLPREALLFIRRARMNNEIACDKYCVSNDLLTFRINKTGINYQFSTSR